MSYEAEASVYDAIYKVTGKNYPAEADNLIRIVKTVLNRSTYQMSLLDVACGTGAHLAKLWDYFDLVEGLDLSDEMLAVARERLPNTVLRQGNMMHFNLGRQFDVVTCLFSAIGYMRSDAGLFLAVDAMARHVKPGGVLIIEPWLTAESFDPAMADNAVFIDEPDLKVARFTHTRRGGDFLTRLNMNYMVLVPGQHVKMFSEEHDLYMWPINHFMAAFQSADMAAIFDPVGLSGNGRGLYIAIKPFWSLFPPP